MAVEGSPEGGVLAGRRSGRSIAVWASGGEARPRLPPDCHGPKGRRGVWGNETLDRWPNPSCQPSTA